MYSLKAAISICGVQLRKNILSGRTGIVALLMGMYLFIVLQPVRDMAWDVGYAATPLAFVFLSCDSISLMVIMAGAVALYSNAPFHDETYPYLIVRAGRGAWVAGNSMYIALLGLVYVAYVWLVSSLTLAPCLELNISWGKIWNTLAMTNASFEYALTFAVPIGVIRYYEPGAALVQALAAAWCCTAFIGASAYLFNSLTNRPIGTWLGAAIIFFDIAIYNLFPSNWIRYSPLSISMISNMINSKYGITLGYSLLSLGAGFALMSALNYAHEKLLSGKRGA